MSGPRDLQATVATYDPIDRSGTVLLDDGRQFGFDGEALSHNVRTLRLGQRVRMVADLSSLDRVITSITIITLRD